MKRREFLQRGLLISAGVALSGVPASVRKAMANKAPWRTFEVTTRLEITDAVGSVRAWAPAPLLNATDYFQGEPDRWTGNFVSAKAIQYDQFGTGLVFAEWTAGEKPPLLEITSRFKVRNRHVDLSRPPNPQATEEQAVLDYFRQPSKFIRTDGVVAATAKHIVAGKASDLDKATAIYDWIVENTFRDPKVRGCGVGTLRRCWKPGISEANALT